MTVGDVDFAKCEKPDELLQLAWDAGFDKKTLIREGSDAAQLLLRGDTGEYFYRPYWPVPHPLDAVDRWSENTGSSAVLGEWLRAFGSAIFPGCFLGAAVAHFVSPRSVGWTMSAGEFLIVVTSFVVHVLVFRLLIGVTLRRRVARLDEERALAIVLDQLRRGMVKSPALVPRAVSSIYTRILLLKAA